MSIKTVDADPTKDFFVHTLTKDVTLTECIMDLLDNSIDGARNHLARTRKDPSGRLDQYRVDIETRQDRFVVRDNCGGIPLTVAEKYAFRFGRVEDPHGESVSSIGLYGIGMKRAMLKIGERISVESATENESFKLDWNVPNWMKSDNWSLTLDAGGDYPLGTSISISDMPIPISKRLNDGNFIAELAGSIARDYSFIMRKGFSVFINGVVIKPYVFEVVVGEGFEPYKEVITIDGVQVDITAGMSAPPPDDISTDAFEYEPSTKADVYGWFILCNDRVVVAADKSVKTIWGRIIGGKRFTTWHPQYYGFLGIVNFRSTDPGKLPWTSTKRNIDDSDPVFQRTIRPMVEATIPFIQYTSDRRMDLQKAHEKEKAAQRQQIESVPVNREMKVPTYEEKPTRVRRVSIQYTKPEDLVRKVSKSLTGRSSASAAEVGRKTFDYYVDLEGIE